MKKLLVIFTLGIFVYACSNSSNQNNDSASSSTSNTPASTEDYDPKRGEGKFENVEVGPGIDAAMAAEGKTISDLKCASCHKYTDERLVGPGWAGVTEKHRPEWIMNFVTNPDPMIDKDPELQAQLELCLVRMPNQNIADDEARMIVEFMRQNDGAQ